jgi:cyclic-di-GMP-binding protein
MLMNFIAPGRESLPPPEFAPDQLREWLTALPQHDAAAAAGALIERLITFNRTDLQARARIRALEMFRDHVDGLLPHLERKLQDAVPPLSGALRHVAYLIEKLFKELAAGYARSVLEVPKTWLSMGFRSQLHVPLVRAMEYHARRLALAQQLYARSPGAVWADLHRLYHLARDWRMDAEPIESPTVSALDVYRTALLLAFAQPSKLNRADFMRVQNYLATHAQLAEITPVRKGTDTACAFAIDHRRDKPGVALAKRKELTLENGEFLLITTALVERIETQLKRVRSGIAANSLGLPNEGATLSYQELLQRLAANWRGERAARPTRTQFHPRIEAWVGLREIWRALRAESPAEPGADHGSGSPAGADAARASEWIVLNESSRGFALRHMSGTPPPIQVGELVAIRPRGRGTIFVCLVRWIQSNNPEHLEVGIQQLAPAAVPAVYKLSEENGGAPEPALFFPQMPTQRKAPAIAVPPDQLRGDRSFSLRHRRGRLNLRPGRIIEKTSSIELIEVWLADQP